ncbi:hypothetical protein SD70_02460 [Gordoniibacillus kamchatkensis]|uniref:Uncharacterized protein n=1 Tax=Gordoniibacillus kamchatkensis TaxID=1590651 RepID=A0ABR5AM63_9BACL|nr:hypothetical protein SD70_02460 [Paenibacillus sp. VKM B-2647]
MALFRLDGYGVVVTKTLTLTAATQYQVTFDLNRDTYDTLNIYRAKAGDYVVQVTDPNQNINKSNMFAVSIVPVKEIKGIWAFGVNFQLYEVLQPKVQPVKISGVEVTEVSAGHYKGAFDMTFDPVAKTILWNGGAAVAINGLAPQSLLLLDADKGDYIMVNVYPWLLPAGTQPITETLVIDNGKITDRDIIRAARKAANTIQQDIITKIEPMIIDTDPGSNYCDDVGMPQTYIRPRNYNKWMSFQIPYPNVLDAAVTGFMNQTQAAVVPRAWTVWDERTGIVELVPSMSAQVIWTFYNSIFVLQYLFNFPSIPGFWHYRITAGLRDLNNDREIIREAIGKKVTLELLNSAGSAYRAGYASQATSRDGVSESAGYTSSAMYGVYGGHFSSYKEWLTENIPKMRTRFGGIQFVSI